ncbi:MAG TPA: hypothetical protein VK178_07270 [Opitutaceae bacterium]|nr:hypothetical protein [Opitutaceae bacterium]
MPPTYLKQILPELAQFVRERVPQVREWPPERLEEWLTWYTVRDFIGVVTRAGTVVAVGCARPVKPGQEKETYASEWQGDTIWIDLAAAIDRAATRDLWFLLVHRFGRREWIGYDRAKHGGRVRREPFDKFINRFFRTS